MPSKISLQQFATELVAPEFRQPLKTSEEALAALNWPLVDFPECCGAKVRVQSFIGSAYYAECEKCHKFMWNVTGPRFGNSWVSTPDPNLIDMNTEHRWITGVAPAEKQGASNGF